MTGKPIPVLTVLAILLPGASCARHDRQHDDRTVITITVRRFEYTPAVIELKKGQPVTLELVSQDRIHGFYIPGLGLRTDVLPGRPSFVEILPEKTGRYSFLCDIFCGEGHGEMNGIIIVND